MNIRRVEANRVVVAALSLALASSEALAWGGSASGARGSASWGGGSGSASGRYGGSASWQAGSGGSATTAHGGTASWSHGSGSATTAYGGSASWNHSAAYGYRPPAAHYGAPYPAVTRYPAPAYAAPHYYGSPYNATTGEVAAAGMAGMAVGAMAGSASAKKQQSSSTTQTASAAQPATISSPLPTGTQLSALPAGCTNAVVKSVEYYGCGPNWFKPVFGSNGVYYQVVPQPF